MYSVMTTYTCTRYRTEMNLRVCACVRVCAATHFLVCDVLPTAVPDRRPCVSSSSLVPLRGAGRAPVAATYVGGGYGSAEEDVLGR